jgi:DNA-binding MarR family transcriptional regulator
MSREHPDNTLHEGIGEAVLGALRRISREMDVHSKSLLPRCGLTGPQVIVLRAAARLGSEASIGDLARSVFLSQATVAGILERLARRGLLQRERCQTDHRRVNVRLTEAGRELVADAPQPLHKHFLEQLAGLADWEQSQILASLNRVVAMMESRELTVSSQSTPSETTSSDLKHNDGDLAGIAMASTGPEALVTTDQATDSRSAAAFEEQGQTGAC